MKIYDFLVFLTAKIRAGHKTAATSPNGKFDHNLSRSGSILYMETKTDLPDENGETDNYDESRNIRAGTGTDGRQISDLYVESDRVRQSKHSEEHAREKRKGGLCQ